jgi:hypothetical protein
MLSLTRAMGVSNFMVLLVIRTVGTSVQLEVGGAGLVTPCEVADKFSKLFQSVCNNHPSISFYYLLNFCFQLLILIQVFLKFLNV